MIRSMLKWGSWSDLAELLSPSFFRVVPMGKAMGQLRALSSNYFDEMRFETACETRQHTLEEAGIPIHVKQGAAERQLGQTADGQMLLELYFHQLYAEGPTFIDLRAERFDGTAEPAVWGVLPYYVDWEGTFIDGVRQMYRGFYRGDDAAFEAAVARVGLEGTGELFREHFGGDDQEEVSFDLATFRETFHKILSRCKERGLKLHPNFIPLGVYLASLYEHLEEAGGSYDVRAAFEAAVPEEGALVEEGEQPGG